MGSIVECYFTSLLFSCDHKLSHIKKGPGNVQVLWSGQSQAVGGSIDLIMWGK